MGPNQTYKLWHSKGNHKQNTLWHKSQQDLFWSTFSSGGNKSKNKQMGLTKLESFWTAKEAINKKTSYELGENICKQCDWQRLNFQNTQTAHITQ